MIDIVNNCVVKCKYLLKSFFWLRWLNVDTYVFLRKISCFIAFNKVIKVFKVRDVLRHALVRLESSAQYTIKRQMNGKEAIRRDLDDVRSCRIPQTTIILLLWEEPVLTISSARLRSFKVAYNLTRCVR